MEGFGPVLTMGKGRAEGVYFGGIARSIGASDEGLVDGDGWRGREVEGVTLKRAGITDGFRGVRVGEAGCIALTLQYESRRVSGNGKPAVNMSEL